MARGLNKLESPASLSTQLLAYLSLYCFTANFDYCLLLTFSVFVLKLPVLARCRPDNKMHCCRVYNMCLCAQHIRLHQISAVIQLLSVNTNITTCLKT